MILDSEKIKISGQVSAKDLLIEAEGGINIAASFYSSNNLKIFGKNISIFNLELTNGIVQLEAGKVLEIAGDKIDLQDGVKLKSGNGSLRLTGKDIIGVGNLESGNVISVLSFGDVSLNSAYSQGNISLTAKDIVSVTKVDTEKGDITLSGRKIDVKYVNGARKLIMYGKEVSGDFKLNNVNNFEVVGIDSKDDLSGLKDFNIVSPLEIDGDFKFIGRNFKNQDVLKAENITLELSGNFINDVNGDITAKGGLNLVGQGFTNYHKMYIDKSFQVKGSTFINDNGGDISASHVEIYLVGKMDGGNALSQKSPR